MKISMSTESMSSRERIMAALQGQDVDRVPWSPCIDGYFLGDVNQVEMDPPDMNGR